MTNAGPGVDAPEAASASVIDAIAFIEMQRQDAQKEAGRAASCSRALRKLQELLEREQDALAQDGPLAGSAANVAAVTAEIERVKKLAVATGTRPASGKSYPAQGKARWKSAEWTPSRNKGRRTMGRAGGR